MTENIYQRNGYENREEYLLCLSEDYGIDLETVHMLADMLGESEMFDGLISALEDAEGMVEDFEQQ